MGAKPLCTLRSILHGFHLFIGFHDLHPLQAVCIFPFLVFSWLIWFEVFWFFVLFGFFFGQGGGSVGCGVFGFWFFLGGLVCFLFLLQRSLRIICKT